MRTLVTTSVPGTGGTFRGANADFVVDEVPLYEASNEGDHIFVRIRKNGITTPACAKRMAQALGCNPRDVGWAGMKDRHALTTQWLSFPPPITPEAIEALSLEDIDVLQTHRHRGKLRTGHLHGNQFTITLRDCSVDANEAAARAEQTLTLLGKHPGAPAWYGAQRFGADGDNAQQARKLLEQRKPMRSKRDRFLISALQSELFNDYLATRLSRELLGTVIGGDVLSFGYAGKSFIADADLGREQARYESGDSVLTGPIFGTKYMQPPDESESAHLEAEILEKHGIAADAFSHLGKKARGARRLLTHRLRDSSVSVVGKSDIVVSFFLPKGMYATCVVEEITGGSPTRSD